MQFITVRELRSQWAGVSRRLSQQHDLVITSHGKPVAILSAVSPDNLEESLAALRRARAIVAVEAIQRQSVTAGKHRTTQKQIQAEIGRARQDRTR